MNNEVKLSKSNRKHLKVFVYLLATCGMILSCSNYPENVKKSLQMAGRNKNELIQVINHYSSDPKDSLKLKAALFLIENMQYHYSDSFLLQPTAEYLMAFNYIDSLIRTFLVSDSIIPNKPFGTLRWKDTVHFDAKEQHNSNTLKREIRFDLETIQSYDFIKHIDKSFTNYLESEYCKDLSFNDFLEAVLPYRSLKEPLELNSPIKDHFYQLFNHEYQINGDPKEANILLNNYLNGFKYLKKTKKQKGEYGQYSILDLWDGDCLQQTIYCVNLLRGVGIPAFIEFTPQWKDRIANRRHFWVSIKDKDGNYKGFSPRYQVIEMENTINSFKSAPKVFRYTFACQNHTPFFKRKNKEFVPPMFSSQFLSDVTANYFKTTSLSLKVNDFPKKSNICYLATLHANNWCPVDYCIFDRKSSTAQFQNIQTGYTYALVCYPGRDAKNIQVLTDPFLFMKDNSIQFIQASEMNTINMRVFQKFHVKEELKQFIQFAVGNKFQLANLRDFSDAATIYQIDTLPLPIIYERIININKKYRYARIITTRKNRGLNMAHVEFHTMHPIRGKTVVGKAPYLISEKDIKTENKQTLLVGKLYSSTKPSLNKPMTKLREKGYDGNMETYSIAEEISFDFGEPVKIGAIRYAIRNANNWVVRGNKYALYYLRNKEWHLHNEQVAENNYMDFKNVPANTIYWLRNLDAGMEEHPFFYHQGKQYFVNRDTISFN